jgi:FixJ family two-component response regulator
MTTAEWPRTIDLDQCDWEQAMPACVLFDRTVFRQVIFGSGAEGLIMTEAERRTVAIVDDDYAVRDSLQFLLEVMQQPAEAFASAAEFLKADRQHLACVILDHHMPCMSGLELAERLRANGESIPILLFTGSPSPSIVARAVKVGIDRVLENPPSAEDLLDFISTTQP